MADIRRTRQHTQCVSDRAASQPLNESALVIGELRCDVTLPLLARSLTDKAYGAANGIAPIEDALRPPQYLNALNIHELGVVKYTVFSVVNAVPVDADPRLRTNRQIGPTHPADTDPKRCNRQGRRMYHQILTARYTQLIKRGAVKGAD